MVSFLHINRIHKDHVEVPGAPKAGSPAVLGGVDEEGECDQVEGAMRFLKIAYSVIKLMCVILFTVCSNDIDTLEYDSL